MPTAIAPGPFQAPREGLRPTIAPAEVYLAMNVAGPVAVTLYVPGPVSKSVVPSIVPATYTLPAASVVTSPAVGGHAAGVELVTLATF